VSFYNFQEAHTAHVQRLAWRLFDQLKPLHNFGKNEREWLGAAARLHDIGTMISYNDHHKHSQTLIVSSGLPGYSPREVAIIALLARYHRKGTPAAGPFLSLFESGDDEKLQKLSAMLRLAEYLERGRNGVVKDVLVRWDKKQLTLTLCATEKPTVELWVTQRNGLDLMESSYGKSVHLES
jgi:exopolyphosphatase/guanosine-5'-triphosphate,3'-diphosphate pyrophosphatase